MCTGVWSGTFLRLAKTIYVRYFWQRNYRMYGHIQCIYMILADPTRLGTSHIVPAVTCSVFF